jgi:hypothetical protein
LRQFLLLSRVPLEKTEFACCFGNKVPKIRVRFGSIFGIGYD